MTKEFDELGQPLAKHLQETYKHDMWLLAIDSNGIRLLGNSLPVTREFNKLVEPLAKYLQEIHEHDMWMLVIDRNGIRLLNDRLRVRSLEPWHEELVVSKSQIQRMKDEQCDGED